MDCDCSAAACGLEGTDRFEDEEAVSDSAAQSAELGYETYSQDNYADLMASDDAPYMASARAPSSAPASAGNDDDRAALQPTNNIPDSKERPVMQAQVVLDRRGFGPGVIDGKMGQSTRNALKGFQEANALEVTGKLDEATKSALAEWERIPATRVVTIPASWGEIAHSEVPDDPAEQAKMERLGYETLDEKLAERFHTTVAVLKQLNPDGKPAGLKAQGKPESKPSPTFTPSSKSTADKDAKAAEESFFSAGQQIRVPNIGADRIAPDAIQDNGWQQTLASLGVGSEQPDLARIVVDESEGWLKGYDADDKLIGLFSVTTGSQNDPLPVGDWGITGVAHNPRFSYQPDLFWDVADNEAEQQLPPGPNGPVGVVWIDLTKEHYGIHGTSAPETIGRVQSHGCVRLTNWDAARLAEMVSSSTKVVFQS